MMNIGETARASGVPAKTIRYYESIGLIAPATRGHNNYRAYDDAGVQQLRFISRARRLGFSTEECAALLALWRDKRRRSAEVKKLALQHAAEIERKLAELTDMRSTVLDLAAKCHGDQRPNCPILNELAAQR